MKSKIIVLLLAIAFFRPCIAQAKTLKYPTDDPQFTVTFSNDWEAEITSAGIISANPKENSRYAVTIFSTGTKNASDTLNETAKELEKNFRDIKPSDPLEIKTAHNITCLQRDFTAKDKDSGSDRVLTIIAFSPDGKNYYALFQGATPVADKEYRQDVVAILKSIKSI